MGVEIGEGFGGRDHHVIVGLEESAAQDKQAKGVLADHLHLAGLENTAAGQVGLDPPGTGLFTD